MKKETLRLKEQHENSKKAAKLIADSIKESVRSSLDQLSDEAFKAARAVVKDDLYLGSNLKNGELFIQICDSLDFDTLKEESFDELISSELEIDWYEDRQKHFEKFADYLERLAKKFREEAKWKPTE